MEQVEAANCACLLSFFFVKSFTQLMKQLTTKQDVEDFVSSIDIFLLDCDGVLWRGNEVIPQVRETLKLLRSKRKIIFFITNNASKSRKNYQKKFQSLDIDVDYVRYFTYILSSKSSA